jgi:hypothetical protein
VTARKYAAVTGQTMLVVLRIASVRSDIGVFLNDPGPLSGRVYRKGRVYVVAVPKGEGSRHVRMRHRFRRSGSESRYIGLLYAKRYAFLGGRHAVSA